MLMVLLVVVIVVELVHSNKSGPTALCPGVIIQCYQQSNSFPVLLKRGFVGLKLIDLLSFCEALNLRLLDYLQQNPPF